MKIMMIILMISIYVTTKNIKYWRAPEKHATVQRYDILQ